MCISMVLLLLSLQYCQGYSKTCSVDSAANRVDNAALNKEATQISTYLQYTALHAVDGDTNPLFAAGSCMHTLWKDSQPLWEWWMVDLGKEYRIDSVTITNRLNSAERQRDFDIFVSLNGTLEDDDHMTDDSLCYHEPDQMGRGETTTFTCQTTPFGQFVQIFMATLDKRDMNICEVTVQGFPAVCIEHIATQTSPTTQTATTTPTTTTTSTTPTTTTTPTPTTTTTSTTPTTTTTSTTPTTTTTSTIPKTTTTPTTPKTSMTSTTATIPTTTSLLTTTPLSLQGNTTTTVPPTCPCVCAGVSSNTTNLTKEALVELVKELVKELKVNKKETSIVKRKLISVGDERQSAQTIGYIGVLALCVPVLLIVSFDLINLWSFATQKKGRVIST